MLKNAVRMKSPHGIMPQLVLAEQNPFLFRNLIYGDYEMY